MLFAICWTARGPLRLRIQWSGGSYQSFSAMGSGVLQLLGENFSFEHFQCIQKGPEVNGWISNNDFALERNKHVPKFPEKIWVLPFLME